MSTDQILLVDDGGVPPRIMEMLARYPCELNVQRGPKQAIAHLMRGAVPKLLLVNLECAGTSVAQILAFSAKLDPCPPVILIANANQTRLVADAIRRGAYDYLMFPLAEETVRAVVGEALRAPTVENRQISAEMADALVTVDAEMERILETVRTVARTDVPVLLLGESGVGKDVLARIIHQTSGRSGQPFIRVNCAALPADLLESELFGYDRGAFTGAITNKPGKFELADRGSILLDEIGEMSPQLQAKLLHVLQDGEFSRLGGKKPIRVDARVLALTNKRLEEAVAHGAFRQDLYFRISVIRVEIPPLRKRKSDIPLLCRHFIEKYNRKFGSAIRELPPDLMKVFTEYDWPGNVRQLENAVKRYLILPGIESLGGPLLEPFPRSEDAPPATDLVQDAAADSGKVPETPELAEQPGGGSGSVIYINPALFETTTSLKELSSLAAGVAERELVLRTLEATKWNRKHAAERLNISYKALLNKLKKWQIDNRRKTA